jgi:imidazolonepropionase-like amidohydrolase
VEEGALADLLMVDGDPLRNIRMIEHPEKNFVVIMKDGRCTKACSKRECNSKGEMPAMVP